MSVIALSVKCSLIEIYLTVTQSQEGLRGPNEQVKGEKSTSWGRLSGYWSPSANQLVSAPLAAPFVQPSNNFHHPTHLTGSLQWHPGQRGASRPSARTDRLGRIGQGPHSRVPRWWAPRGLAAIP
jgi:hypothetical protein